MASLIQGFEYDIFISYRKNDNRYDGWVTEFVSNLTKELEATVKDKISTYFDENQKDGLLETNDVDKSLLKKLKALIFVPILSQTYCDPKSYAWKNEFVQFNKMINKDSIGREVTLRSGNVASRILPVRIHELDLTDLNMLQDETGAPLRAIDFFYKEPGVNRPLRPLDSEEKNHNRTSYRNQINKTANSIKEILISIRNPGFDLQADTTHVSAGNTFTKSIAVLPFVNMSNDPEQVYLSDGISEEIINTLVQIPDLKVPGRTSSFSFRNRDEDLRAIGEKLNVATILEGSVRKSGNRIRIAVQLIEASSGYHLWSQKFDRDLNDVFIIQDEIAKTIVDKLQVTIAGKPAETMERLQTSNVHAYQLYLKGMAFFYKRGLYMFEGIQCFMDALSIDPDYALALAGLADSYTMLCLHSYMSPEEAWPKASEAANHAAKVGPGLAEVQSAIATIALLFEHKWEKAEKGYLKALELNPRYLQARCWYSLFYLQCFRHDHSEAIRHARIAVEYDPYSSYAHSINGAVASLGGLYNEGLEAAKKAVEYDSESFLSWHNLGFSHYCMGDISQAISAYKHALGISGRHNWALISLLSLLNEPTEYQDLQEAKFIYNELTSKAKLGYTSPAMLAVASAVIGNKEDAIHFTTQALNRHDPYLLQTNVDRPDNKAFHSIKEISEMIKRLRNY